MEYLLTNKDDSPLYLFESILPASMIQNFKVHKYFDEDLFGLVGDSHRPPYRWFLVGP